MNSSCWVIVDTETDGLMDPIHVVEIAAQRMDGWEPVGDRFRVLLNHNIPIPPEATAVHGYTAEYLKRHGEDPILAHEKFRRYAGELPLVAHNLSFDWNRVLSQEWLRMGLPQIGQPGFCTLMLSRRLVDECKSYKLEILRNTFGLSSKDAHRAFADVEALVGLFSKVFRPRLEAAGIQTYDLVSEFSKRTPVAKCLAHVNGTKSQIKSALKTVSEDLWYYNTGADDLSH